MIGKTFSRLTVIRKEIVKDRGWNKTLWVCQCKCGAVRRNTKSNLLRGIVKSCGCLKRDRKLTHGKSHLAEYRIWIDMWSRCSNPKSGRWPNYGKRGIKVCRRWRKFENFWEDMGQRPGSKYSIERENNDGNYSPGNCIWGTMDQQNRNKRTNRITEFAGLALTSAEWAKKTGIPVRTLGCRFEAGWSPERALTTPVAKRVWTKSPRRRKEVRDAKRGKKVEGSLYPKEARK